MVETETSWVLKLHADLSAGANIVDSVPLQSNLNLSSPGVKLHGAGFIVSQEEAAQWGYAPDGELSRVLKPYLNGRDLASTPRGVLVIDFFGYSQEEASRFGQPYQRVLERVKPERDANNRETYRRYWWLFGEPRRDFRPALQGLKRYIATVETSKHRYFTFLDSQFLADNKLIAIALDDAFHLGVLSSRVHCVWALASGGRLGVGNDPVYIKTKCFDAFPFPAPSTEVLSKIRALGDRLDAFRKSQQAKHPELTLTGMYNLLEKLRSGEAFTAKEKALHEKALTSILKQLHDELDAAVLEAYGWPQTISDEELLEQLAALNHARAEEEAHGLIRYLRPEFQAPTVSPTEETAAEKVIPKEKKQEPTAKRDGASTSEVRGAWPAEVSDQFMAIRQLLRQEERPWTVEEVQARFKSSRRETIRQRLEALEGLGVVRKQSSGTQERWMSQ